jgi:5-methylcytosine-specific restriction enzyme subunit McrC
MLEITELRAGLSIRSFSYVGRVRVGDLTITVRPKLDRTSLLTLLRYAYGFRKLHLLPEAAQAFDQSGFIDLLVAQLVAEAEELLARGLHRSYVRRSEWLSAPRGRIDVGQLAEQGGVYTARLPCTYHPRVQDTILNRALRGGLELAGRLAADLGLRRAARRLSATFEEVVSSITLTRATIDRAVTSVNRLTVAYAPALTLTRLLYDAQSVVLGDAAQVVRLPGFLFDMNRFFQALLSRFLRDNLPEFTIREEHQLSGMMQYVHGFNPRGRRPPVPRPDFVVLRRGQAVAILDAKYRDLWAHKLPREMLYQLAVYAGSHTTREAGILYPTTDGGAQEARIAIRDPTSGQEAGRVHLRPVVLPVLEDLLSREDTAAAERARRQYAERLLFGK